LATWWRQESRDALGMTITEKILAAHSGKSSVAPGELINVKVDVVLGNDVTGRTPQGNSPK
jgi:homoaconitase/3-isopropylmalate dehydratase large subunit